MSWQIVVFCTHILHIIKVLYYNEVSLSLRHNPNCKEVRSTVIVGITCTRKLQQVHQIVQITSIVFIFTTRSEYCHVMICCEGSCGCLWPSYHCMRLFCDDMRLLRWHETVLWLHETVPWLSVDPRQYTVQFLSCDTWSMVTCNCQIFAWALMTTQVRESCVWIICTQLWLFMNSCLHEILWNYLRFVSGWP